MNYRNLALWPSLSSLLLTSLFASDPSGFALWRADEIAAHGKALASKVDAHKLASETLAEYGNHYTQVTHREGNGEAELHQDQVDLFVIESGQGTLVIGGTVVNPRNTAPGETRGTSIDGGEKKLLRPGDIVHIPANVPHQLFVASGKQITYFVVKVQSK